MTRDEAIKEAGIDKVEAVENENVDFTNIVTDGTEYAGCTGFYAAVNLDNGEFLVMYIFVNTDEVNAVDELDQIDWDHYIQTAEFEIE